MRNTPKNPLMDQVKLHVEMKKFPQTPSAKSIIIPKSMQGPSR